MFLRRTVVTMSRMTAPVREVTTSTSDANLGMGTLCASSNSPSALRRAFSLSNSIASNPFPAGVIVEAAKVSRPPFVQKFMLPRSTTLSPSLGMYDLSAPNLTQAIWDSLSLRVK